MGTAAQPVRVGMVVGESLRGILVTPTSSVEGGHLQHVVLICPNKWGAQHADRGGSQLVFTSVGLIT
jgi:hypothetical protein